MGLESIEKLRRLAPVGIGRNDFMAVCDAVEREIAELQECWAQEAREHADDSARLAELAHENAELKREIAESYMPLPVDADGKPIKVGDIVHDIDGIIDCFKVTSVGVNRVVGVNGVWFYANKLCHRKSIQHVLAEFAAEADGYERHGEEWQQLLTKYTDEINGMFGRAE